MVNELRSGDLCVVGSDAFADYRTHLLPWRECVRRLPEYCAKLDLPANAQEFVAHLKQWLADTARTLDTSFPDKRQHVTIGADGEPVLKRTVGPRDPGQRRRLAAGADPPHADAQSARRAGQHRALAPVHPALWAAVGQ